MKFDVTLEEARLIRTACAQAQTEHEMDAENLTKRGAAIENIIYATEMAQKYKDLSYKIRLQFDQAVMKEAAKLNESTEN